MNKNLINKMTGLAAIGLAMVCAGGVASAALVDYYQPAVNDGSATPWNMAWFGGQANASSIVPITSLPGYVPAPPNITGNTGALSAFDYWDGGNQFIATGWYDGTVWTTSPTTNLLYFTNVIYDIYYDSTASTIPLSTFNSTGEALQVTFVSGSNGQIYLGGQNITTADTWQHVVFPINPTTAGIDTVAGFGFKKYTGSPVSGTAVFYVANMGLEAEGTPPPPPIMNAPNVQPVIPGLNIYDDGAANDRQSFDVVPTNLVTSVDYDYGWNTSGQPVTYSLTIAAQPNGVASTYQSHIMIMPGNNILDGAPDWNQANCIVWFIETQPDGSCNAFLRYKINDANNNNYNWQALVVGEGGLVGAIADPLGPVGQWQMKIDPTTWQVTLTNPHGASSTVAIDSGDFGAGNFPSPLSVYFGTQPNANNRSQQTVFTQASITGCPNPITMDLTQPLDPNRTGGRWSLASSAFTTPTTAKYWIGWSIPAISYSLYSAPTVSGPWSLVGTPINNVVYQNNFASAGISPGTGWTDGSSGATLTTSWTAGEQTLTYNLLSTPTVTSSLNAQLNVPPASPAATQIDFDIKVVSAGSTEDLYGGYGYFTLGVQNGGGYTYTGVYSTELGSYGLACVDTYAHITGVLTGSQTTLLQNVDLQLYSDTGRAINGPVEIQITNLVISEAGVTTPTIYTIGGVYNCYILASEMPTSGAGFFRMERPY